MNREELEALKPNELYQTAKDLGIKTKKKSPAEVVTLILDSVAGTVLQEDEADETENEAEIIPGDDEEGPAEGDLTGEEGAEDDAEEEAAAPIEQTVDVPKLTATDKQFIKKNPDLDARIKADKEFEKTKPQEPRLGAVQTFNPSAPVGHHWPTVAETKAALKSHIARGLEILELHEEYFHFKVQNREAAGNLKQPLNQIVLQANILLRPTKAPTES